MYSVGATQLWLRVRVPLVDSLLNIQRNSTSITKDHSTDPQSQWPLPGIYLLFSPPVKFRLQEVQENFGVAYIHLDFR